MDKITKEQRRKNMQAIKSVSKLESVVSKELWKRNIRYRRNVNTLFGKPDIAIKKYKLVIFIDSCFWHVCPIHGNIPKTNIEFWKNKLERNQARDIEVTYFYKEHGWNIIRVWEHEVKENFDVTIDMIITAIEKSKKQISKDK